MRIVSFNIWNFGIFSNVNVEGLPPGLSIFFGGNEAGKSTCLEFLRSMLTGFPEKTAFFRQMANPNGEIGGSVDLLQKEENNETLIRVSRRENGIFSIEDDGGKQLDPELLDKILSGVDREVYKNIFGFSLSELEALDSLDAGEMRQVLYGAGFGADALSPAKALKKLRSQKDEIYLPGGKNRKLNLAMRGLEETRRKIAALEEDSASFNNIGFELDAKSRALYKLRAEKNGLEEQRRKLERRMGAWRQWREWTETGERLKALGPLPGSFPENAAARLARLEEALDSTERLVKARESRLAQLRERRGALAPDEALLSELAVLNGLRELKASYKQAIGAAAGLRENLDRERLGLERDLARLGPGWDCDRIRSTDRSLFSQGDLEKKAADMTAADAAWRAASGELARINTEAARSRDDVARLEASLAEFPRTEALLNEAERESLRQNMARLEESARLGPARKKALENARATFSRALTLAQIEPAESENGDDGVPAGAAKRLNEILKRQPEALAAARETLAALEGVEAARTSLNDLENAADQQKQKIEAASEAWRAIAGPGRAELESKAKSLRALRSLVSNIDAEKERLSELDRRISSEQAKKGGRNWAFLFFAILFLLIGGGIFIANWTFGITEIDFGSGMILPLNLWASYVVLACGVIFLAAGFPGTRREEKQRRQEFMQLQSRRETSAMHLAELGSQAQRLCQESGVESLDPITLDATEMLVEREREQCVHEERSRQDLTALEEDLASRQAECVQAQARVAELESAAQQARRRWHALMQGINPGFVPLPESADVFFARAESALLAYSNVENAKKELDALWEDLHLIEQNITSLPVVAQKLEEAEVPLSLEEAAREILAECGQADAIAERRRHMEGELERQRERSGHVGAEQKTASDKLEECANRLAKAREAWNAALSSLGFEESLAPETAREAFKLMESCLAAEERVTQATRAIAMNDDAINAMRAPLGSLLAKLERAVERDASGSENWLASLEKLEEDAQHAQTAMRQRDNFDAAIEDEETGLGADKAALAAAEAKVRALLNQAQAKDADDFLRLDRLYAEKRGLEKKKEGLASQLEAIAGAEGFEELVESLARESQESQEADLVRLGQEIGRKTDTELEEARIVAELKERARKLADDGELASLRQKEAILLEDIDRLSGCWSACAAAEALLTKAKEQYEKENQPQMIKNASRIFAAITGGRWKGLSLSLEDMGIMALPAAGAPVDPEFLSRGAREQAYLALRLAHIEGHAAKAQPLPVLMDEVLVNFDPERTEKAAQAITAFARSHAGAQQVIYFTCQPGIVDLLRKCDPAVGLFKIESGHIRREAA